MKKLDKEILIGESYRLSSDTFQYILHTRYMGKDKDKQPKEQWTTSFHPTFKQVAKKICECELKESFDEDLNNVLIAFTEKVNLLTKHLEVAK